MASEDSHEDSLYTADFFDSTDSDPVHLEHALPSRPRVRKDRLGGRLKPAPLQTPPAQTLETSDELRRYQETIGCLRRTCEEHEHNEDRVGKDLLAMTNRYLQSQSEKEELEKRARAAEEEVRQLRERLRQQQQQLDGLGRDTDVDVVGRVGMHFTQNIHNHSQTTLSSGSGSASGSGSGSGVVDSSEYVVVAVQQHQNVPRINMNVDASTSHFASSSSSQHHLPLLGLTVTTDVPALLRHLNFQTLSLANSATASASLRQGAREPTLRTGDLRALSDRLGCVFVQILTDHRKSTSTKNKGEVTVVEVAIQALLCWHIHWVVSEWPNHHQIGDEIAENALTANTSTGDAEDSLLFCKIYPPLVARATHDIAALLSLSGASGSVEDLYRRQLDRIGDTIQVLFKSAEALAAELRSPPPPPSSAEGKASASSAPEYTVIYERPGGQLKKDLMHSRPLGTSAVSSTASSPSLATRTTSPPLLSMSRWKPPSPTKAKGGSADARILCTRELGLVRLRCRAGSGRRAEGGGEVLVKAVVLFEGDFAH